MGTIVSERKDAIRSDLESARSDFHQLLHSLGDDDLRRRSANPRWTNGQIVWHMAFAFMLVLELVPLAELFSRLPHKVSKGFASALDWATPAFNVVNRLGPLGGARLHSRESIGRMFDRVLDRLLTLVDSMNDERLDRGMHYPRRWDPTSFSDYMTVEAILRYPVAHMRHHWNQVA